MGGGGGGGLLLLLLDDSGLDYSGHLLQAGGGQPLDGLQRDAGGGGDA